MCKFLDYMDSSSYTYVYEMAFIIYLGVERLHEKHNLLNYFKYSAIYPHFSALAFPIPIPS